MYNVIALCSVSLICFAGWEVSQHKWHFQLLIIACNFLIRYIDEFRITEKAKCKINIGVLLTFN